ncbi:MAG: sigma-70 family RNA polymerase sigma factor [Flavobacteriales bacterium]|nr:sigma-70 family RNA polymerase sigma factor [Flavobacteriales bacterium]
MDEQATIALVLNGDQRAFGALVHRYKHMVHTVTWRVLRHEQDAEEATQDVFVKAYQRLGEYHGTSKFSTWLYSIAYRTAITALRRRKPDSRSLEELSVVGREPGTTPAEPTADRVAALERALRHLSPEDAAVVTMFYLEELSVQEIVTITGIGASNVKVKLHRSRKRLQEVLQLQLKEEAWDLTTGN